MVLNCCFCFAPQAMHLRTDRKGRPYLSCGMCATRAFVHTEQALRGPLLVAEWLGQVGDEGRIRYSGTADGLRRSIRFGEPAPSIAGFLDKKVEGAPVGAS